MKMKIATVLLVGALSSTSVFAESPCIKCRQDVMYESQQCMDSVKSQSEMYACKKQGQESLASCDNKFCSPPVSDQDKKDWGLVIDFVKNNMDVIRKAGSFKHAVSHASYKAPGEPMPSRYMVYVLGGKATYAVVDISRSSGEIKPTLACITHISLPEFQGSLKDICKQ